MDTPKISVIVPVYNVEKYLRQCLDSILAQTFTDFELLLIDDGSLDTSGTICDEYAALDSRVRVFHKENGGVSSARNLGIDESKGELICFVDSDDWVEENYCQTIVDNIGDADIMYFSEVWNYKDGCIAVYSSGECSCNDKLEIENEIRHMIENRARHNYCGYTWNKVFVSKIIRDNNIRFVEGLSVSEDEIFTLDFCVNASRLKTIFAPIYNYRYFEAGLTLRVKSVDEWFRLARCFGERSKLLSSGYLISLYKNRMVRYMEKAIDADFSLKTWKRVKKFCKEEKIRIIYIELLKRLTRSFYRKHLKPSK